MITRIAQSWLRSPRLCYVQKLDVRLYLRTLTTSSIAGSPRSRQSADNILFDHEIEEDEAEGEQDGDELDEIHDDDTSLVQRDGQRPKGWVAPDIMRSAKREVKWLMADKTTLAKRIQEALEKGQVQLATTITRLGSNRGKDEAVVAWNLLIKHHMEQKPTPHYDVAMELFTEMKRRNQTPDAFTYGTIFSGLGQHPRPRAVVKQAYNLYRRMQDSSKIEPNILNVNMMISITGRAGDMERFWSVIRDIPESGPCSATSATYQSIFEALRHRMIDQVDTEGGIASDPLELLRAAQAVWSAAIDAWGRGTLEMNDDVVCSMVKVLNAVPAVSVSDQVFSLIEQTTGVKRPQKPIPNKAESEYDYYEVYQSVKNQPYVVMVEPNNRILMGILEACSRSGRKSVAQYYWDVFTGQNGFRIIPDVPVLKQYLRVLRIARSSADAVALVMNWHDPYTLANPVFVIAMAACQRNAWRPGVLAESAKLYEFRKSIFSWPDMMVLDKFTEILDVSMVNINTEPAVIIRALDILGSDVQDQLKKPGYGWARRGERFQEGSHDSFKQSSVIIAKRVIGVVDYLVNEHNVDPRRFAATKQQLAEFVRSHYGNEPPRSSRSYSEQLGPARHREQSVVEARSMSNSWQGAG